MGVVGPPRASRQRSRRLRKKLRIGEFQELGFSLTFALDESVPDSSREAFWDQFLSEAIEGQGLQIGGHWRRAFVCVDGQGSATEADRQRLRAWLSQRAEVLPGSVEVGSLVDAWYD